MLKGIIGIIGGCVMAIAGIVSNPFTEKSTVTVDEWTLIDITDAAGNSILEEETETETEVYRTYIDDEYLNEVEYNSQSNNW